MEEPKPPSDFYTKWKRNRQRYLSRFTKDKSGANAEVAPIVISSLARRQVVKQIPVKL